MKHLTLKKSYYKIRIIITFCLVTILLVLTLSFVSYKFIKKLYLDQLSDQVNLVTKMISHQIDPKYLDLLQVGTPTISTRNYFRGIFAENLSTGFHSQIFIFDKNLNVVVRSDSIISTGGQLLLLNQTEISDLRPNGSAVSLPFKGDDGKWYLWGFFRLNDNYWLALKENAAKLQRVEDFSIEFFYIGLGGILLSFIVAWLMAQSLTRPIDQLVEFSKEIGEGNFKAPLPQNTHGELRILTQSLDKMKKNIEAHNKEKENILAQIAHEIRNPLGGIELLANLTKEDFEKIESSSITTDYLDKIICEVNSLKSLITSYLNFSRPLPANAEWIYLNNFLSEVDNNFKTDFSRRNIRFSYRNEIEKIWFDKSHLKQIFLNLITNSLESMKQGGNINVSIREKNMKSQINFSDNGPGIKEENLARIFEPFFTTKKDGTGLGLAICKKLCNENKAELLVENNKENGSSFTIIKDITSDK